MYISYHDDLGDFLLVNHLPELYSTVLIIWRGGGYILVLVVVKAIDIRCIYVINAYNSMRRQLSIQKQSKVSRPTW